MRETPKPPLGGLLAAVQAIPREAVPALMVAIAARLAEPEPAPPAVEAPVPPPEADKLLTAEQVAERLGLDVAAVARRALPFRVKVSRRCVRYSEQGLARWIENRPSGH